ncbi:hypothetical protein Xcel_2065 [Xylanimonas cellulosilytica DSM 15894]|uniref:Uncharacterized protein n=1 Tax=Xylanimonas cellulosilytica (strain DSM 15894 / JCM 12276 / CECT 5975 / KCTC 9989 / LMG 20990 / NBRC 107835 / XIL07) TaxID=446471 RepID=D1BU70_XYLCX|nr:hypothetical protein [Xylanimonas cellulosilytica]ACZ31083.1 hypothetical protein Xcel_2065 [Xylanimonas cellulosilytica DSM 15894]
MSAPDRFPDPSPQARARVETDARTWQAFLRTQAVNVPLNEPDGAHSVLVQTRQGEVCWATPEAADDWNGRLWR